MVDRREVPGGYDQLRLGGGMVAAAIGDDSVATFLQRTGIFSATDDAVGLDAGDGGEFVQNAEGELVWGEAVDAVGGALAESLVVGREGSRIVRRDASVERPKFVGRLGDEVSQIADEGVGHFAASVGCGDEDDPLYVGAGLPEEGFPEIGPIFGREIQRFKGPVKGDVPIGVTGSDDGGFRNQPAHAVTDQYRVAHGGIVAFRIEEGAQFVELGAEHAGRVERGWRGGVKEMPDLVALANRVISAEVIAQFRPDEGRGEEPVDHDQRGFLRIVGLGQINGGRAGRLASNQAGQGGGFELPGAGEKGGPGHGPVGCQGPGFSTDCDGIVADGAEEGNLHAADAGDRGACFGPSADGAGDRLGRIIALDRRGAAVFPHPKQGGADSGTLVAGRELADFVIDGGAQGIEVVDGIAAGGFTGEADLVGRADSFVPEQRGGLAGAALMPEFDEMSQRVVALRTAG